MTIRDDLDAAFGTRWRNPPQACLADAVDMDADEMAQAVVPKPTRRGLDVLREIRAVAEQAMAVTSISGTLEPHVAQVTAEQIRRLAVELAG
jgi:delta-aminolevulinic acid dehydratase/porphobilinogen synthase